MKIEVTHVLKENNMLYLFITNENSSFYFETYDIENNYEFVSSKRTNYFNYNFHAINIYNENFYIFGGCINDNYRNLKHITVMKTDMSKIYIYKNENNIVFPKKRLFLENINSTIINNSIYLIGGVSKIDDDNDISDENILSDIWSYNIVTRKWEKHVERIFDYVEGKFFYDYIQIGGKCNNGDIIITGKCINIHFFVFKTENRILIQINLNLIIKEKLFINNYCLLCVEEYDGKIYFIFNNLKSLLCICKKEIEGKEFEIYNIVKKSHIDPAFFFDDKNGNIFLLNRNLWNNNMENTNTYYLKKDLYKYKIENTLYSWLINNYGILNDILPKKIIDDIII